MRTFIITGGILVFFLFTTQPLELPLLVLLVPFIIFFMWVKTGTLVMFDTISFLRDRPKARIVANSLASIAMLVLVLQSLGQLSWRDVLLISIITLGLLFYLHKTDLLS